MKKQGEPGDSPVRSLGDEQDGAIPVGKGIVQQVGDLIGVRGDRRKVAAEYLLNLADLVRVRGQCSAVDPSN